MITIQNESDAFAVLQRLLDGEDFGIERIRFKGWPTYNLYLKGEKFEASVTPSVMRALLELQRGVYRTATQAIYDDTNINRLTDEQRSQFELVLTVSQGSSDFLAKFWEIFEKIAKDGIGKMSGKQVAVVLVAAGLLYTGASVSEHYIDQLSKEAEQKADVQKKQIDADVQKSHDEVTTKQLQILADVVKKFPETRQIAEDAKTVQHEVLRGSGEAQTIRLNGATLSGDRAREITHEDRQISEDFKFDGLYRILAVDTSDSEVTRVRIGNGDGQFLANFKDDSLGSRQIARLQTNLMSREPIRIAGSGKKLRGKIKSARITSIGDATSS